MPTTTAILDQQQPHLLVVDRLLEADAVGLRRLALESALYHRLESRGHGVALGAALIHGEAVKFWLAPGEPLALSVEPWHGGRRNWTDKRRFPLGSKLDAIVWRLETIASERIEDRARQAEHERQRDAAMRRAARRWRKESEREVQPDWLLGWARDWRTAKRLTAFLGALETRLPVEGRSPALSEWLHWARAHAGALDPLTASGLAEITRHAEAVAREPFEEEPYDNLDEEEWRSLGFLDPYLADLDLGEPPEDNPAIARASPRGDR